MPTKQTLVPTPGSPSALDRGCTCPVMDNNNGRGMNGDFWVNENCPLHGPKATQPKEPGQ